MNYQELEKLVLKWANDKGILEKATPMAQANKTLEEVQGLIEAVYWQNFNIKTYVNEKGKQVNTKEEIKDEKGYLIINDFEIKQEED